MVPCNGGGTCNINEILYRHVGRMGFYLPSRMNVPQFLSKQGLRRLRDSRIQAFEVLPWVKPYTFTRQSTWCNKHVGNNTPHKDAGDIDSTLSFHFLLIISSLALRLALLDNAPGPSQAEAIISIGCKEAFDLELLHTCIRSQNISAKLWNR